MKLRQRPHKSPVGVKFKFYEEYSLRLFHMEAPPRFPNVYGKWWSESLHTYNLENIIFQVKKENMEIDQCQC